MIIRSLLAAALLSAASYAHADAVATLKDFVEHVKSGRASFTQTVTSPDGAKKKSSSGTFEFARPDRFRFAYSKPYEQLIVADGKKVWMYDVDLAQVTVSPLGDTVGSSPAMLLSGDREVGDGFNVVQTFMRDGLEWVKLEPKTGAADFRSVTIGFDGAAPRRLELVDGLNQVTRIALANVVVNPELADSVFQFTPPAGVDVIGEKG